MSKKKKLIIGGSIGLLLLLLLLIGVLASKSAVVDGDLAEEEEEIVIEAVSKQSLEESILVTGKLVPESEQKLYRDVENGEIKTFHVKEGDQVKKGDPLFTYDSSSLDREFQAAVNAREMSQQQVNMLEKQIAALDKQMKEAKSAGEASEWEEQEEPSWVDPSQLEMEKNQLLLELETTKAEVANAQHDINEIDKLRQQLTVKSKIDGKVVQLNEQEERTEEGLAEPVLHIVSTKPLKVIGTMSEFDSVKIKKDQPVIIRPKVFKDREWMGKVEAVSDFPTDAGGEMDYASGDGNVTMYPFTVLIEEDTKELRQGFHVSLEVKIAGGDKVVAVPHSAIVDDLMMSMEDEMTASDTRQDLDLSDDEGLQFVYVLANGRLERRNVETGRMSDEYVEIISGVEVDEVIVLNPGPAMYDGMEVMSYDQLD